jgi:hypothetical protein
LVPASPSGALVGAAAGGFFGGVASLGVDYIADGREIEGMEDEAVYRNARDLNRMQDSVNAHTQWAVEDAMNRHHVNLPKDGALDDVRNAVNAGWSESDRLMEDNEFRPTP